MAVVNEISVESALALGKSALEAENWVEAHTYFSHVLEVDPRHVQALSGKGLAAGWQSNLVRPRLQEMLACYERVKEFKEPGSDLHVAMAVDMFEILRVYFRTSREHTMRFISVEDAQYDHFDRCEETLQVLQVVMADHPKFPEMRDFMVEILKTSLNTSGCMGEQRARFKQLLSQMPETKPPSKSAPPRARSPVEKKLAFVGLVGALLAAILVAAASYFLIQPESLSGWIGTAVLGFFMFPFATHFLLQTIRRFIIIPAPTPAAPGQERIKPGKSPGQV